MLGFIIVTIILLLSLLFYLHKRRSQPWEAQGIRSPSGIPFVGHILMLFLGKESWKAADKKYHKYKSDGMYVVHEPFYDNVHICDLEMIKDVMVKDFDYFTDRRNFKSGDKRFDEMLSIMSGDSWKALRASVTPTFTSGKIKGMFNIIKTKGDDLCLRIDQEMIENNHVDIRKIFGYFGMDVIANCTFGLDTNYLKVGNSSDKFYKEATKIISPSLKTILVFIILITFPSAMKVIKFPNKSLDYMEKLILETLKERKESGLKRGDYLDLLIELVKENDNGESNYDFTTNTLVAQSILFFLAGFDTTSNALSSAVYLLAKNRDKQKILIEELEEKVLTDGNFNYQNINDCHYLDSAISEAVRLFPPAPLLERTCVKDYKFQSNDVVIKKGSVVTLLPYSLHHDPEFWNNPEEFIPERFLPENKQDIIPFSYMPFGMGPRNCIAMRFALMETKICLAKLFLNFEVKLKPGHEQIKFKRQSNVMKPDDDGVRIQARRIERE